jgi:hypothetical protein
VLDCGWLDKESSYYAPPFLERFRLAKVHHVIVVGLPMYEQNISLGLLYTVLYAIAIVETPFTIASSKSAALLGSMVRSANSKIIFNEG